MHSTTMVESGDAEARGVHAQQGKVRKQRVMHMQSSKCHHPP
jgi:hypothetical protein